MPSKTEVLDGLDFGRVDSESEKDLAKRFVRTRQFDKFSNENTRLILGPKGSGKSAIFRLLTEYETDARELLGEDVRDDIIIGEATGGNDLRNVSSFDLNELKSEENFSYERFWRVYIALKIASKLGDEGYKSDGELGDVLQAFSDETDWRLLPVIKDLWNAVISDPPTVSSLSIGKLTVEFGNEDHLDIVEVLRQE